MILNLNGLNIQIKRQRLSHCIKIRAQAIQCTHKTVFKYEGINRVKVKRMAKTIPCKPQPKTKL